MDDLLNEFIAETREMLHASQSELVAWEADPADRARLDAIFRCVHTVKGNCGFFDFPELERLSHAAEDALADVRAGRRTSDRNLVSAILAIFDQIARMIDAIEAGEPTDAAANEALIAALEPDALAGPQDDHQAAEMPQGQSSGDTLSAKERSAPSVAPNAASALSTPRSIRLPVELLDQVMSGVSDMVLARNDLGHRLKMAGAEPTIDGPFERLSAILSDLREIVTRMRMQRVEYLFSLFPRLVRDIAGELGKQVMVEIEGGEVELDREMVEMIRDPLIHIIRNALDHGIETPGERLASGKRETGLLTIAACQSGNRISILIGDDGRGLDEEKIALKALENELVTKSELAEMEREEILHLVFEPGFSTASKVSNLSGRGVGLDVVRDNIERIGGSINLSSRPGKGSLFHLQIPLTLSIISGLTVEQGGQSFGIPQSFVEEIVNLSSDSVDFRQVGERAMVTYRGRRTPCLSLGEALGIDHAFATDERAAVILRMNNGDCFALMVDRIHAISDMVIKPLAPLLASVELYGGTTLLDDGRPMLLLDIPQIAAAHGMASDERRNAAPRFEREQSPREVRDTKAMAMLFIGCDGRQRAIRLDLIERIETVEPRQIEFDGDKARAVIDGEVWPLAGIAPEQLDDRPLRLLRLGVGQSQMLYAAARVEDVGPIDSASLMHDDDPAVEAVFAHCGRPVALLDAYRLLAAHGKARKDASAQLCLIGKDEWSRSVLGPLLEKAGYRTTTASGDDVDVILALDTAPPTPCKAPVIVLHDHKDAEPSESENQTAIYRYDREALLAALAKLGSQTRSGEKAA